MNKNEITWTIITWLDGNAGEDGNILYKIAHKSWACACMMLLWSWQSWLQKYVQYRLKRCSGTETGYWLNRGVTCRAFWKEDRKSATTFNFPDVCFALKYILNSIDAKTYLRTSFIKTLYLEVVELIIPTTVSLLIINKTLWFLESCPKVQVPKL